MKSAKQIRSVGSRFNSKSHAYNLSSAKTFLGRLADKAMKGEPVYIVRGQHRFLLQYVPEMDPIPMRPPDFFANAYTSSDIEEENILAKTSVIKPPKDLE